MLRLDTPRGKLVRSGAPPLLLMLWAEGEATGTRWGAVLWEERQGKGTRRYRGHGTEHMQARGQGRGEARAEAAITEDTEGKD